MFRLIFSLALCCTLAQPVSAALGAGKSAPDFTAPASLAGKTFSFSLKKALSRGPVVVYFFPAAFTSVCNIQAHQFAANHEKFLAAGATVVGVSLDGIARLNAFSKDPNYCGGKIAVASDAEGKIAKSYDLRVQSAPTGTTDTQGEAIEHGLVEPVTFVVAPDGKIAAVITDDSPVANVNKALKAVQSLTGELISRAPARVSAGRV